jgi:hypothetical protein
MDSIRLLFAVTLMLLVGFTISFSQMLGMPDSLPWIAAAWIAWVAGVAWVRASGW